MNATANHGDLRDGHAGSTCHAHCDNSAQPGHTEQPATSPHMWLPQIMGHPPIPALAIRYEVHDSLE